MSERAELFREAAAELDLFGVEAYPADVFIPPTRETFREINGLLQRERGHGLDGVAAECYRRGIRLCARRLRELAVSDE